ncbi:MAG: hypothetical protein GY842_00565 [bacterium]|nr:hypothetical protein [bacterium]
MSDEKKKALGVWGITGPQFIHGLKDKRVTVAVSTGKAFGGVLVGADPYNLILRQEGGLDMLVGKGSVVYLHEARERNDGR